MKTYYLILLTLILFVVSCTDTQQNIPAEQTASASDIISVTEQQKNNAGIKSALPVIKPLTALLHVNGSVDVPPQSLISLSVPLGGFLKNVTVLPGSFVKKGQVIATMEDMAYIELQQQYLTARTKLEYFEKEWQRQQELSKTKTASEKTAQFSQSEWQTQKIMVKALEEKVRLLGIQPDKLQDNTMSRSISIYAPISGYISTVKANIGAYIPQGDIIGTLVDPSDIHATLTVFEKDIASISIGQKVRIQKADNPNIFYEATVFLISHNVDEHRSARIHCHFSEKHEELLPGMFLSADIEIPKNNCVTVSEKAVVRKGNTEGVFIENDANTFAFVTVKTGIRHAGEVEITATMSGNDIRDKRIVMQGAYSLFGIMTNSGGE
ncbi:MAG TPA: efflux RND transporter periplasmic adaptor subunit [Candidatus Kapabacteria bacterium]|jgi:cobalt-zinc-cadmium efflux system membrane fusion protein|nr:efflux RND transporter periplasmic adaptor subunit [Candidatus Kapabacteria bacterium]